MMLDIDKMNLDEVDATPRDCWFENSNLVDEIFMHTHGSLKEAMDLKGYMWKHKHDASFMGKINYILKKEIERLNIAV